MTSSPAFRKLPTIQDCPIHRNVFRECYVSLAARGYFNKAQIVKHQGLEAMEGAIRWDYLARLISERKYDIWRKMVMDEGLSDADQMDPDIATPPNGNGVMLVSLALKFFREPATAKREPSLDNMGQYLAGGHGKTTAGYANVTFANGKFAVKKAQRLECVKNGTAAASANYQDKLREILPGENLAELEDKT